MVKDPLNPLYLIIFVNKEFKEENHGKGTTVDNDYVRRSTENYYEQDQSNNDYTGSNIYSNRADYYINLYLNIHKSLSQTLP